jgi:hypothetical protein
VDKARKKPDASVHRGVSHARRHVVPVGLGAQVATSSVGARSAASCLQAGHPYRPFGRAMGHHHRNRPIPSVGPACPDQARAPSRRCLKPLDHPSVHCDEINALHRAIHETVRAWAANWHPDWRPAGCGPVSRLARACSAALVPRVTCRENERATARGPGPSGGRASLPSYQRMRRSPARSWDR